MNSSVSNFFFWEGKYQQEQELVLGEQESFHAAKVLRMKPGDRVMLTDGNGYLLQGSITEAHPKKLKVSIQQADFYKKNRPFYLHIAIAPTKSSDRMEWMLEKVIEIGVDAITFFSSKHSERDKINLDRFQKIAVSAIKQSMQPYLPTIRGMVKIEEAMAVTEEQRFVADVPEEIGKTLAKEIELQKSYCIFIGPEGGFSPEEMDALKKNNFSSVSLGPNRLRTETAGLFACGVVNALHQSQPSLL